MHTLFAAGRSIDLHPLIDLPEARGGEIVFNSRSPEAMEVTPVFYTHNGETVIGDAVKIQSAEIRYVNIEDLLPARYRHEKNWGGFALSYYGANREMWSQFRFLGVNGGASVDEFFTVKEESRSAVYEAAWWMPEKSEAIVALGNISDAPTSATLSFGNGHSRTVQLQPHATEVVREEHRNEGTESVKIDVAGAVGSVVPTGIITTKDGSFSSVIRFYDPTKAKQPNLYANGFRIKGTTPHMVLKNTNQSAIAVLPKIIPMSGSAGMVTLSQLSLNPNETKEVDLSELLSAAKTRSDLDVVSVEVTNWAAPGSVIGSVYATDNQTGIDYDVPLRDSGPIRSMTGAYPWKIDGDYKSIAYVTNITDEPMECVVELAYEGGRFTLGPRKLQPRQTVNFDIEKIRDEQMKDMTGHALPANVTHGQFKWAIRGASNGKIVLIGRTEMVSRTQNVSSSYSCPMDCGPTYEASGTFPGDLIIGESGSASVTETASWNYGYTMGPYAVSASWSADHPVASFDPSPASTTSITGTDQGSADVSAFVGWYDRYDWDGLECIYNGTYPSIVDDLIHILSTPHLFYSISVTQSNLNCPPDFFGYGAEVRYGVADIVGIPLTKAGLTPRELVYINGFIQYPFVYQSFADPPQTNSQGLFTDRPIGSCFRVDPFSSLNPCVFVDQHFDIEVPNDVGSPHSIITVTHRKDCRRGIRVEVENGPAVQTYTLGEVP